MIHVFRFSSAGIYVDITIAVNMPPILQRACEESDVSCLALWYCNDCDASMCEDCWHDQRAHSKGKTARDGKPHEQTPLRIHELYNRILEARTYKHELTTLHVGDADTLWFGQ